MRAWMMRSAVIAIAVVSYFGSGTRAHAIFGVGDIVSDPGHTAATIGGWVEQGANMVTSLNQSLQHLSTAVDQLLFFGDPSKIASLIGLDGLLGEDSALGGLLGAGLQLGNSLFSTFDSIQRIGSQGMQLYSIGQNLADGEVLMALNQLGMGSITNLVGIEGALEGFNAGVDSFGQLNTMGQAAWGNVSGALRQVQSATTDQEVQKAQANLNAQLQYALSLTERQTADQALLSTTFQAEEAQQRYSQIRKDQSTINAFYKALGLPPPVQEDAVRAGLKKNNPALTGTGPYDPNGVSVKLTEYGYSDDPYMDSWTAKGYGNVGNKLTSGIVAVSPELRAQMGLRNGDVISVTQADGRKAYGYVGDTTAAGLSGHRVDFYSPDGRRYNDFTGGTVAVEARGNDSWKGTALEQLGEANLKSVLDKYGTF